MYPVVEGHETRILLTSKLFSKADTLKLFRITPPQNKAVTLTAVVEFSNGSRLCAYDIELGSKYNRNDTQKVWVLNKQDISLLEHEQLRMFLVLRSIQPHSSESILNDPVGLGILAIEIENQNYFRLDDIYDYHEFYGLSIVRSLWTFGLAYNGLAYPPYTEVLGGAEYGFQITAGEVTKSSDMVGHLYRPFNTSRQYLHDLEVNRFTDFKPDDLLTTSPLNFKSLRPTELPARTWYDEFGIREEDVEILREFGFVKYINDLEQKKQFPFEHSKEQAYSRNIRNSSIDAGAPFTISFLIDVVLEAESWDEANTKVKLPKLLNYSFKDQNSTRASIYPYLSYLPIKPNKPYLTQISLRQKPSQTAKNALISTYDCEGTFRLLSFENVSKLANETHVQTVDFTSPQKYGVQQSLVGMFDLKHNGNLVFDYKPSPSVGFGVLLRLGLLVW